MGTKISDCYRFALSIDNELFMTGDVRSIMMIFNNLEGVSFILREEYTFSQWLAQMQSEYTETAFNDGAKIMMKTPSGDMIKESRIGSALKLKTVEA